MMLAESFKALIDARRGGRISRASATSKEKAVECIHHAAARHITQFSDHFLAPSGLRTTQFSILAKLRRLGPMTINALAAEMVMDRTALGRRILPLERDGLIADEQGSRDGRSKELQVTEAGEAHFRAAMKGWVQAQQQFQAAFGAERTADMRALLHAVAATDLGTTAITVAE
jgi:DNA-binding MarR family transcriptional regulator